MPPTQEQEIPTSAGMETATQTVDRINQTRAASGNVNMSELATQGESLTMPTPAPINADVRGTLSAGQEAVEAFSAQEQARAAQAGQQYSASEQRLREQFGILGTQADTRQQLEGQAGVEGFSQDLQKFQQQLRRQMADLDQFDVDNVNTIEAMRVDASKRDITKRTFNAMSAEAGIQNAVQRANKVAATRATIAAVDITQGNLTAATQQVDKALNAIYEPIRMGIQMESQFLQNNLSLFTTAQTNAANARMMGIQRQIAEIDRAQDMVNMVVSNGYARAGEIEELVALSEKPQEQQAYAQMIANRGAAQMRNLQIEQMQMSIAASVATVNAKNQPDPMQAIMMSLFDETDQGVVSLDEYVAARTEGFMGPISPDQYAQLEAEYTQQVANYNPQQDKSQKLAFLVASGAMTPTQADYVREYVGIQSPKEGAQAAESVRVAQTVARDIQMIFKNIEFAGAESATLIEQIEGRRGTEGNVPMWSGLARVRTRRMADKAQPIYDLKSALDSVASNMSMENLNQMRQNSPTGAALGNVSDKQSSLLSDLLGSTKLEQSPEQLRIVMDDLLNFQYDVIYGNPTEIQAAYQSGRVDYSRAQEMLAARMSASPEMIGLSRDIVKTDRISSIQLTPDGKLVPIK